MNHRAVYDATVEGRGTAEGDREMTRVREVVQNGAMKALLAALGPAADHLRHLREPA